MANEAPTSQPIHVELLPLSGWRRIRAHYGRVFLRALVIGIFSAAVAIGVGWMAQGYERQVTGYDPVVTANERMQYEDRQQGAVGDERGILQKGADWVKEVGNVRSAGELAALSDTYLGLRYRYDALVGLVDLAAFWLPFLIAFYVTAKVLSILRRIAKGSTVDRDVEENQKRLAAAINAMDRIEA